MARARTKLSASIRPASRHALRSPVLVLLAVALLALWPSRHSHAQDLYDVETLRTFRLTFHDANWLNLLRQNFVSQSLILADLEVDGVVYPNVGVRIRGNTSYTALPAGSEKYSLKIKLDHVDEDQELMGYDTVNLNNGFRDPTFTREVVYNNFVARFIPNPRANHVLVELNGQNWGVYINVQQADKTLMRERFGNGDGLRLICSNRPNGPGLAYAGPDPAAYADYEIQNDGGLTDPVGTLIDTTFALSNEPLASWQNIDALFAIDSALWSLTLENLLTDEDGYVNKGCDFVTYRDINDGRMHLLQRDGNETLTQSAWLPSRNFGFVTRPVKNRLMAVPELRQRFMAHYRTIFDDFDWTYFGPIFAAHRQRIEAHVAADLKRIYSFENFQANFDGTVDLARPGLAGGMLVGLRQFVEDRAAFLASNAELAAVAPRIVSVEAQPERPSVNQPVWVRATVVPTTAPVATVRVYFRPSRSLPYERMDMLDDGASNDGAAGDGVFGAPLPVAGSPGQIVDWYVEAISSNTFASAAYAPELAERKPAQVVFSLGSQPTMRITEWMYAGAGGEFFELTNRSPHPVDLAGWSTDDDSARVGDFLLAPLGAVSSGESVIVTESDAESFRVAWGLGPSVRILGGLGGFSGAGLGRNDAIHLFDPTGRLIDRLQYGDQDFAGSIRTQNRSGQPSCDALGSNDVSMWSLATVGDAHGSYVASGGDIGNPGTFVAIGCSLMHVDGFE